MHIHVGPLAYELQLIKGFIDFNGDECLGLCDHVDLAILISDQASPDHRISVMWHEIAHAWNRVFNVTAAPLDDEGMANVIAIAMGDIDPLTIARAQRYVATGKDLPHYMFPGRRDPIPFVGGVD